MKQAAFPVALLLFGCGEVSRVVDPDNYRAQADNAVWASKNDILAAAETCQEPNINPVRAGDAWSIQTKDGRFIDKDKSRCIDGELGRQKLLVTR